MEATMDGEFRQADFLGGLALVLAVLCIVVAAVGVGTATFQSVSGSAHVDQSGTASPQALPSPQSGNSSAQVSPKADKAPPSAQQAPAAQGQQPAKVTAPATPAASNAGASGTGGK
jgi:hypothetical protein